MVNCIEYNLANITGNLDILDRTVRSVVELLGEKSLKIAVAESCTGGLISELITNVSGASSVYELGVCTYTEGMKTRLLGVSAETLGTYGVYSGETAIAMAKGVKEISGADITVGITGIAGPTGAVAGKPVGTVYVAFCYPDGEEIFLLTLDKIGGVDRKLIRRYTALAVFTQLENHFTADLERN